MRRVVLLALLVAGLTEAGECFGADAASTQSIRSLLDEGRYEEAEAQAAAVASNAETLPAGERLAVQQLYVEALVRNGRGAEARTHELAIALVGSDWPAPAIDRAAAGVNRRLLGQVLFAAAKYREAAVELQAAVHVHERIPGSTPADVAADLEALALAYIRLDRPTASGAAIDRAVAIEDGKGGGNSARLAHALGTRGVIWQRRGDYRRAGADLERALTIREALGGAHSETARILTFYGDQLWFTGDPVRGREYLTRALALGERTLRSGHPDLALTLKYLAIVADDLGELDRAKALRQRGLSIAEAAYGPAHPQVAFLRHDLAISAFRRGEFGEARRLLQQVLDSHVKRLGLGHPDVAETLHTLGVISASLGDFPEATRLQRRAIDIWMRTVGADHPTIPWALVALGSALASQGLHREAVPILERALVMRERSLGRDHIQVAETLTVLANSLASLGYSQRANVLARRSVTLWEKSRAAEGLSDALMARARVETTRRDFASAKRDYDEALTVRLPTFGAAHPSIGEARAGLAIALAALGQRDAAVSAALEAERIGRDHLRLTTAYLPERQALGYAASQARGLDLALSVMAPPDAGAVLDAVIRGRAIVLDEMALRQRLRAGATAEALAPMWTALTTAGRRLANLAVAGPGDLPPGVYAAALDAARREREVAEGALAERSAMMGRQLAHTEIGLDDVRKALSEDSAVVSFVRYDRSEFVATPSGGISRRTTPHYAALVVRGGEAAPVAVSIGPAAMVDDLVSAWRRTALDGITPMGEAHAGAERLLRRAGTSLRTRIWDPVIPHIAGAARVFIVPDGVLNLVPFAALPVDATRYLVDAGPAIQYLSAERDVLAVDATGHGPRKGLLAIGGPTYGPIGSGTSARPPSGPRLVEAAPRRGRRSTCGTFDSLTFPALPASLREVEDIGALWRTLNPAGTGVDSPALVLTAARAGEAAFKATSPGYRVLHLATHGFFLGGSCAEPMASTRGVSVITTPKRKPEAAPLAARLPDNPLLLSGLAMAGANRRFTAGPKDEDGILTAAEVAALDLDGVEWAVLSACDTGLGEIRAGEGVFGLRRAFRIAGARTVIMSLWPVEDRAARAWMRALYQGRLEQKLSTVDAMRHASATILADRRAKGLSTHPFFWAGFVAAGDWR